MYTIVISRKITSQAWATFKSTCLFAVNLRNILKDIWDTINESVSIGNATNMTARNESDQKRQRI